MDTDLLSGLGSEELTGVSATLLKAVLDHVNAHVLILKPLSENTGLIDFTYIAHRKSSENHTPALIPGKKFHTTNRELLDALTKTFQTGIAAHLNKAYIFKEDEQFKITCIKIPDAVLLLYNEDVKDDSHFVSQVIETSPDIIYILDLNTRKIIYTSRAITDILGYSREQVAKMKNPLFDLMFPDDVQPMLEHLKKIKTLTNDATVLEIEYRLKNSSGDYHWFCDRNTVFRRNSRNIPVEKIGVTQDITARKQQEDQLRTNRDILHQSEAIVEMGSWEYNAQTGEFKWSEGMYHLFNLPKDTHLTPNIYFDYTPEEERLLVQRIVDNITLSFSPFEETITLLPAHKEKKHIKIRAAVMHDAKKRPLKVIGVDLDITTQIRAANVIVDLNDILQRKNEDLESLNAELKTFNMIAARDYKETIQALYTSLEYIINKEARLLSDSSKGNIRRAQSAIQKMKLLTDDINNYLQLYDIGINKSIIDPNAILETVLSGLKSKLEQAEGVVDIMTLPPLPADPYLFSRLMIHLLDNSIKFRKLVTPLQVKIKYSKADEMNAVPSAIRNTPYTIISVSDNGIGFEEEDAERIFEPFFRLPHKTNYKGSGIGLAACRKIMAMHDGFITAEGNPAHGATFNCYFPVANYQDSEIKLYP